MYELNWVDNAQQCTTLTFPLKFFSRVSQQSTHQPVMKTQYDDLNQSYCRSNATTAAYFVAIS